MERRAKLSYLEGRKLFSPWDLAVAAAVLAVALSAFLFVPKSEGQYAEVYRDGALVVRLPLDVDVSYTLRNGDGYNVIRVEDGRVYVESASCKDKSCVNFGKKSRGGDQIVCLPNRMVIKITGGRNGGYDGVVG